MSIKEKEKQLLDEWKEKGQCDNIFGKKEFFVKDGLIDEINYSKAPIKILYLLKEVNGGDEDCDLRDFVRDGARSATWDNITRWTKGIFEYFKYKNELDWDSLEKIDTYDRSQILKSIIAVNLKKIPGRCTADYKKIEDFLKKQINKTFLKKQLSIYNSDIIICCGTGWLYSRYINQIDWDKTTRGIKYKKENSKIIIDYLHPNTRVSSNLLYYGIIDAIKEISRIK